MNIAINTKMIATAINPSSIKNGSKTNHQDHVATIPMFANLRTMNINPRIVKKLNRLEFFSCDSMLSILRSTDVFILIIYTITAD